MKFFFDNNLPPQLAKALNELVSPEGHQVSHLRDKYQADTSDIDWLTALARESDGPWIIVSGDMRISRLKAERKAWLDSGHIIFFLSKGWTNIEPYTQLSKLIKMFPEVVRMAVRARPGDGFIIPPSANKPKKMT